MQSTKPNTHVRKPIKTASGLELERVYVYLPASMWNDLYALSKPLNISLSQYLTDHLPHLLSQLKQGKNDDNYTKNSNNK